MSSTIAFEDLADRILVQLPMCPTMVAANALRDAARDFYDETHAWKEPLLAFQILEKTYQYPAVAPFGTAIDRITTLDLDGEPPEQWWFQPPDKIRMGGRLPRVGTTIVPEAVLTVAHNARQIPCSHANQWAHIWEHGALWYLRSQKDTPWYSPNDAEYQRQLFRSAMLDVRNRVDAGFRDDNLRVAPHPFI